MYVARPSWRRQRFYCHSNSHSFVAHLFCLLVIDLRVFSLFLVVCSFPVMKLGMEGEGFFCFYFILLIIFYFIIIIIIF